MNISRINLPLADSTNTFLRSMIEAEATGAVVSPGHLPGLTLVLAERQTAGRGQKGNSWESEPGKNLTFSLLCHPAFLLASRQFLLSQCMALAVRDALAEHVGGVEVKWPNDIWVDGRKISGTLIECDLCGKTIANCIIGVGININQTHFTSDAPNPVSLKQITKREHDREQVLSSVLNRFVQLYESLSDGGEEHIRERYMSHLYRREGVHPYRDAQGEFMAEIVAVEPTGHLCLRRADGATARYEFKEIQFIHP